MYAVDDHRTGVDVEKCARIERKEWISLVLHPSVTKRVHNILWQTSVKRCGPSHAEPSNRQAGV